MDPTALDAVTVLKMATCEGAKALGLGDITGSIETGKKADIIIVDTHKPHLTPLYNPYSHLVYSAGGADVSHSIINGRLVMEDRRLLTRPGRMMPPSASMCFAADRDGFFPEPI
jgi:5-methylthioadenosine/S-adenosylhomocysteine deaminase